MPDVRQYIISPAPGSVCGITVYTGARPTVVISDLPGNPGESVEINFKEAVQKVCRAFLKRRSPAEVDWIFRRTNGRLFRVRLWNDASVAGWGPIDGLERVVHPDRLGRVIIPDVARLDTAVSAVVAG